MNKGEFTHMSAATPGDFYWAFDSKLGVILIEAVELTDKDRSLITARIPNNQQLYRKVHGDLFTILEPAGESWEPSVQFITMTAYVPSPKETPYMWLQGSRVKR